VREWLAFRDCRFIAVLFVVGATSFLGGWSIVRAEAYPINLLRPPELDYSSIKDES
jgi:hypothetical protein